MISGRQTLTAAQTALLTDAVLAGLSFDVQETSVCWQAAPQVVSEGKVSGPLPAHYAPPVVMREAFPPAASVKGLPEALAAWQIWQEGTPGGVMVVLSGEGPLSPEADVLLGNMLKAVGLANRPVALVGLAGNPSKTQQPEVQQAIAAAATQAAPTHTLVLGQGVLGVLLGKLQGVEGWQAAPSDVGLPGWVGVTFPLELLLAKPLFKSLAWQHLQAWQKRWN
jgi:hypothetical protein